jgi:hypothetical protein
LNPKKNLAIDQVFGNWASNVARGSLVFSGRCCNRAPVGAGQTWCLARAIVVTPQARAIPLFPSGIAAWGDGRVAPRDPDRRMHSGAERRVAQLALLVLVFALVSMNHCIASTRLTLSWSRCGQKTVWKAY